MSTGRRHRLEHPGSMVYIRGRMRCCDDGKGCGQGEGRESGDAVIEIRAARSGDLREIFEIYNDAVLHSVATFDTEPKSRNQQKRWFEKHGQRYPVLVAVDGNGIVGWASLGEWSEKKAYAGTAEISLYVRDSRRGKGIGARLTKAVLEKGKEIGIHVVVARIADTNRPSMRILESLGFERIGVMREVGRKFGKLLDVTLMQKILIEKGE